MLISVSVKSQTSGTKKIQAHFQVLHFQRKPRHSVLAVLADVVCCNVQCIWFCPLIVLWACFIVLLIFVVIVCKRSLISSICFFPHFSSLCMLFLLFPSSSLLLRRTSSPRASDAAPSTEAAAHGWYLSLLLLPAQHGILCMPAEYSTARNAADMHGTGERS